MLFLLSFSIYNLVVLVV